MEFNDQACLPSALDHAEVARVSVSPVLDPETRKDLGQYMTPAPIAGFMAAMFGDLPQEVRLLDAGAGIGSLTAAFIKEVCARERKPGSLDVTAFEIDAQLAAHLAATLDACARECRQAGIRFSARILQEDFILHAAEPLLSAHPVHGRYDCVILNPPYAKITSTSVTRKALRQLGIETSNLYTAFVATALDQLRPEGQLVAITPRSFCNGTYFGPFRQFLLERAALQNVHVFESRKNSFRDDAVLQENIVFRLVRSTSAPERILLSSSHHPDGSDAVSRSLPYTEVVMPDDPNRFIRLPLSEADGELAYRTRHLPCTLGDLGLSVSTGRVVEFRARDYLRMMPQDGTVPLIHPLHLDHGQVSWPGPEGKKPNALISHEAIRTLLVPRGVYVLTKRFSSKEEKRRLVAAVYDPGQMPPPPVSHVGFENHLNYFHLRGRGMRLDLARGLALFLNSTAIDQVFRQFSGHTQVNAMDLRNLRYPTLAHLEEVGRETRNLPPSQEEIDDIVERKLFRTT